MFFSLVGVINGLVYFFSIAGYESTNSRRHLCHPTPGVVQKNSRSIIFTGFLHFQKSTAQVQCFLKMVMKNVTSKLNVFYRMSFFSSKILEKLQTITKRGETLIDFARPTKIQKFLQEECCIFFKGTINPLQLFVEKRQFFNQTYQ